MAALPVFLPEKLKIRGHYILTEMSTPNAVRNIASPPADIRHQRRLNFAAHYDDDASVRAGIYGPARRNLLPDFNAADPRGHDWSDDKCDVE